MAEGDVQYRVPLYLVVDQADDEGWSGAKDPVLDGLVPALVRRIEEAADLRGAVSLAVIGFANQARVHLSMGPLPGRALHLRRMRGGFRSYSNALRGVLDAIFAATYVTDFAHYPPLVLIVTDGVSDLDDDWEAALAKLIEHEAEAVVAAIQYPGPLGMRGNGLPEYPRGGGSRPGDGHPDHLALVAVDIIRSHLRQVEEDRLARRAEPERSGPVPASPKAAGAKHSNPEPPEPRPAKLTGPEWTGEFTPYSVGDPGNAARSVRPVPDVTEWDRRDTVLDGVRLHDDQDEVAVELRAASVRGLSHRYYGTVRQDDYAFRCTPDRRYLVAAVSDGVSNSKLSHKAANLVTRMGCEVVVSMLRTHRPEVLDWRALVLGLSDQIVALGEKVIERPEGETPLTHREVAGHMAATALFAVVDLRPDQGALWAHVFSVGDSPAFVLRGGRTWEPQGAVKNAGNLVALSSTAALPVARDDFDPPVAVRLGPRDVLLLMTDGVGDPLGDGDNSVGRFLAQVWASPPLPLAFAAQVDFARRSQDDDRTALAVWPEADRWQSR